MVLRFVVHGETSHVMNTFGNVSTSAILNHELTVAVGVMHTLTGFHIVRCLAEGSSQISGDEKLARTALQALLFCI